MSVSKRNGSKYFYIQFQYNGKTYIKSSKTPEKQLALNLEAQWRKRSKTRLWVDFLIRQPSIKFTLGLTRNLYQIQFGTPWKPLFSGLSRHRFLDS